MHVGRDVPDHLAAKVGSGLGLVPGERFELIVRLDGRRPDADVLVVTNARVASIKSDEVPARQVRLQVLADEIQAWRLTRKMRSRLMVTSGHGRNTVFGTGLAGYDDDPVDAALTALVSGRADPVVAKALTALRARAHWISSPSGRSVHVIDRGAVLQDAVTEADPDSYRLVGLVEAQLRHCDYWPASEARRHVSVCVPAGGCFLARVPGPSGDAAHTERIAEALVTVDAIKLRKSPGAEAGVVDRLMTAVAQIRSSPAWTSEQSIEARVDVDKEITGIALAAHRTAELRSGLGERPDGNSETARRAADVYDATVTSLDTVAGRLVERVDVLESYRDRLQKLSRELRDLDGAERIDRVSEQATELAATVPGGAVAEAGPSSGVGSPGDGGGSPTGVVPLPRRTPDASRGVVPSRHSPTATAERMDSAAAVRDAVTALRREADRLGTLVPTTDGTAGKANDD